ncbi:unnamed protein product [Microthlaspi erraticum]|uniref:Aspartic peptidase DDI1-type domain-containing protein n=1 Tax=Microthlaspi erraticum TaxID=1685480 RepID=A0A6D2HPY9_9BRAS|nr:unnamed protein product [Microthlaspi erraticum]
MLPGKAIANPKDNEDVAIQEEEESVDIEAEERVEKESVEPEPEKQRGQRTRAVKRKQEEEGNSFCSSTIQTNATFSNTFQETNGREMQKVLISNYLRSIEDPFVDALMMIKPYQKFLKDAILERTKEVQGMVVLSQECSAIIQSKTVTKKLGDPGSFTLPVPWTISFQEDLCDLGASVSIMPLTVARRLGFEKYKECISL